VCAHIDRSRVSSDMEIIVDQVSDEDAVVGRVKVEGIEAQIVAHYGWLAQI
jgi:hypothetical protein